MTTRGRWAGSLMYDGKVHQEFREGRAYGEVWGWQEVKRGHWQAVPRSGLKLKEEVERKSGQKGIGHLILACVLKKNSRLRDRKVLVGMERKVHAE